MYICSITKRQIIMESFFRLLGIILFFLPSIFIAFVGEGPVDPKSPITFLILFIVSIVYHLWLQKKYNWRLPKDVKDTHRW